MYIIIPLGGLGTRFKKCGYNNPKPLVNVFGKPIIFWLLDNLNLNNIKKILIPYNKELAKYNFEDEIRNKYPKYNFIFLELQNDTRGATETLLLMLNNLTSDADCPILSLDGDNFYNCDIINYWNGQNRIFTFEDYTNEPIYSYVLEKDGYLSDIVEKTKISNNACCGSYGFSSWFLLKDYCKKVINNNILQKGEFYISNVIREMINENIKFTNYTIEKKNYICLGTPLHVKIFYNNFPKINALTKKNMIENKRICFDLDNTLVTYPKIKNDYTTVEPLENNINLLRYLKSLGNTIIIYTARRMKTHNGNTGCLMKDIGKITFDTLEKLNIPYDEIYFGKPYADFYIDDKAINSFSYLDKELGYYNTKIEPRDFNNITISNNIEVLRKSSENLKGQICYYLNIPNEIKDIFPFFFNYDNLNYKWYEMEKINGISVSNLYVKQELSLETLESIMDTLKRIHNSKCQENFDINIYENYSNKLLKRYKEYDYSRFEKSEKLFNELFNKLLEYENKNLGKIGVIHGDYVLTNVMINSLGKIKVLDMRGLLGNKETIRGDIIYDYAKLYQSLIGYDEILLDSFISNEYKNNIITFFKNKFIKEFGEEYFKYLEIICASLLFTLIPLHNNEKCNKYYNLIKKIFAF